jgi:hypothetical protein
VVGVVAVEGCSGKECEDAGGDEEGSDEGVRPGVEHVSSNRVMMYEFRDRCSAAARAAARSLRFFPSRRRNAVSGITQR